MAIGTTTQYGSNVGIRNLFAPQFQSVVFRNNKFTSLFPTVPSQGDTAWRWKVNVAGNTSAEVFSEGGAQPTPVAQTWVNAAASYVYFRVMVRYTGHARDAVMRGGAFPGLNVLDEEITLGFAEVRDLVNTTFLGASNNGIQLAVDSAGTYASIDRSTYSAWGSYENAVSGVLTYAVVDTMRESIRDNDRGGRMDLLIMPENQVSNLMLLVGAPGTQNSSYRYDATASGGALQLAPVEAAARFGSAAVIGLPDMTDTVICGLDTSVGIKFVEHRPFDVRQDMSGDDDVFQLSWAGTLVYPNPLKAGKLTGVTA